MSAKILLVDDDSQFREELRLYLEEYDIVEAGDGEEALDLLKRPNEIELVILDVILPGVSGTEILRRIKERDPGLGVIMLTGYSSKDVAVEALKGHADDYVEKSEDMSRLKGIIERFLAEKCRSARPDNSNNKNKIDHVKNFLERNCCKKTSLEDVAMAVSLSPKYLSRIFKERCGINFVEYRRRVKLKEAKEMLRSFDLNINQIADKLGYMNAESFIRMFKKTTGLSPSQYRKVRPRHPLKKSAKR